MSGENLLNSVCERIKFDKERLERNELGRIQVESFNLSQFWIQFCASVQALNNEVTKVGFMCGKMPFPLGRDIDPMMQDLLQCYTVMRDLYLVLPVDVGAVLFKAVTSAVIDIMAALLGFVKSLHDLSEKGAEERLTLTGTFWDACNAVDSLPKDNLQATLKVLEGEVNLASDAQEELETTLKEDNEEEDESWTDSERKLAQNALGLVKVTHVCARWLKEAVRKAGSSAPSQQLDLAASVALTVSPALDNFVSELYHPVDFQTVYQMAEKLVEVLRSILTMVSESHFATAFGSENINRIEQFISHNHQKVDPSINPVPQLTTLSLDSTNSVTGYSHPVPFLNPTSCVVLDMEVCDICWKEWTSNDEDCMKSDVKKEKKQDKEKKAVADDAAPTAPPCPPPLESLPHPQSRTTDVIVVMFLATVLLLYVLIKDWLLIAINGILVCLYLFFIRRRLPVPAYGTMDLVEYLSKI